MKNDAPSAVSEPDGPEDRDPPADGEAAGAEAEAASASFAELPQGFVGGLLRRLREDDISVLADFLEWQSQPLEFFEKVEGAHEFLDQLTFKIKESKSRMSKDVLTQFSLDFLRDTLASYGYNPKFVGVQCKALITYHQNQKNLAKAIEVCEFLIENGITDDDARGFHVRLDEFHRLKKKVDERGGDLSAISFAPVEEDEEE